MKAKTIFALIALSILVSSNLEAANPTLPNYSTTGEYTINSGTYDGDNSNRNFVEAGPGVNIVVNADSNGTGTIVSDTTYQMWLFNSHGEYIENDRSAGGSIVYNGNISAEMHGAYVGTKGDSFAPINCNNSNSTLTINGNVNLNTSNYYSTDALNYTGSTYLMRALSGSALTLNGGANLSALTHNATGNAYSSAILAKNYVSSPTINLGQSSNDLIHIHDIITEAPSAGKGAESYGILATSSAGPSTINVYGRTIIENLSATGKGYSAAAGIHVGTISTINIFSDLTVRNVVGFNDDPSMVFVDALQAVNSGVLNINVNADNEIKVDGDITSTSGGQVNMKLTNADSYLRGATYEETTGRINLTLRNGGTWYIIKDTTIIDVTVDGGVMVLELGGTFNYNGEFNLEDLSGVSTLRFETSASSDTGQIVLGANATVEVAQDSKVDVLIGDDFRDESQEHRILLIDTVACSTVSFDTSDFVSSFTWLNGGGAASNWHLEFVANEGLYAVHVIPEPAVAAVVLGVLSLGFIAYRRRK